MFEPENDDGYDDVNFCKYHSTMSFVVPMAVTKIRIVYEIIVILYILFYLVNLLL